VTLDQWISDYDSNWPSGSAGFRLRGGRVLWTSADYPDGCSGHLVRVSRIVHERGGVFTRVAYVDRDAEIQFVDRAGSVMLVQGTESRR